MSGMETKYSSPNFKQNPQNGRLFIIKKSIEMRYLHAAKRYEQASQSHCCKLLIFRKNSQKLRFGGARKFTTFLLFFIKFLAWLSSRFWSGKFIDFKENLQGWSIYKHFFRFFRQFQNFAAKGDFFQFVMHQKNCSI